MQSNHEGALIDAIHQAQDVYDGIVYNSGAHAHYSYEPYDAIEAISVLVVEVRISDIHARSILQHIGDFADVHSKRFCIRYAGLS